MSNINKEVGLNIRRIREARFLIVDATILYQVVFCRFSLFRTCKWEWAS